MAKKTLKYPESNNFNMYVCGPTVYNHVHIGNIRPVITFDMIKNALKFQGYNVNYIKNITDINEKIEEQAVIENCSVEAIVEKYTQAFYEILEALNINFKETKIISIKEEIEAMVILIEKMVKNDYAYQTSDGIYFDTSKIDNYGMYVAGRKIEEQSQGIRIKNEEKRNDNDFVLWKFDNDENSYETRIGSGKPGWHTECAAVIDKYFSSNTINLHGGGIDLKFPHHENENAQYLAANNCLIAANWLHNGHLNVNNDKMSKSLNNFVLAKDILQIHSSATIRLWFAQSDFQKPINYTEELLKLEEGKLAKINNALSKFSAIFPNENINEFNFENQYFKTVKEAAKNLDFPLISQNIFDLVKKMEKNLNLEMAQTIVASLKILGITYYPPKINSELFTLIEKRKEAKKQHEFDLADQIKETIKDSYQLEVIDSNYDQKPISYLLGEIK